MNKELVNYSQTAFSERAASATFKSGEAITAKIERNNHGKPSQLKSGMQTFSLVSRDPVITGTVRFNGIDTLTGNWVSVGLPSQKTVDVLGALKGLPTLLDPKAHSVSINGVVKQINGSTGSFELATMKGKLSVRAPVLFPIGTQLKLVLSKEVPDEYWQLIRGTLSNGTVKGLISQLSNGLYHFNSQSAHLKLTLPLRITNGSTTTFQVVTTGAGPKLFLLEPAHALAQITGSGEKLLLQTLPHINKPLEAMQLSNSPSEQLIKMLLPKQQALHTVIDNILNITAHRTGKMLLRYEPVRLSINALMGHVLQIPELQSAKSPLIIQQILQFYSQQLSTTLPPEQNLRPSFQLALLQVAQSLKSLEGHIHRMSSIPLVPQLSLPRKLADGLYSDLGRFLFHKDSDKALVMTHQLKNNLSELSSQLTELLKAVDSGLSRQKVLQLNLLRNEGSQCQSFEMPVKQDGQTSAIGFFLQQLADKDRRKKDNKHNGYSVTLSFDLPSLGKVKSIIQCDADQAIQAEFFAEQSTTNQKLHNSLAQLKEALMKKGLCVSHIANYQAKLSKDNETLCNSTYEQLVNVKV